jgi:hypothetical protein
VAAGDVRSKWATTPKVATYPEFIWSQANGELDGYVNGRRAISTSQMPSGRVLFGRWSDCLIATWEGVSAQINEFSFASTGQVQIIVSVLVGIGFRYSSAFITSTDSAAQ